MPLMMVADEKPAADVAAVAAGSVLTLLTELENVVTETEIPQQRALHYVTGLKISDRASYK